jgi:hypothetical protein
LGHYTVTHPAGFPNYAVTIIMYNNANPPRAQWSATPAPGLNSFTVVCFNQTDGVFQDLAFQFNLAPIV